MLTFLDVQADAEHILLNRVDNDVREIDVSCQPRPLERSGWGTKVSVQRCMESWVALGSQSEAYAHAPVVTAKWNDPPLDTQEYTPQESTQDIYVLFAVVVYNRDVAIFDMHLFVCALLVGGKVWDERSHVEQNVSDVPLPHL